MRDEQSASRDVTAGELVYRAETQGIRVCVWPAVLDAETSPERCIYAHSYRVLVENIGEEAAQLLNRHWRIYSNGKQILDVKGEGVVGKTPVLPPSSQFEYTSWTVVHDPVGAMEGSYTFRSERGEFFDVLVPRFDLVFTDESLVQ